MHAVYPSHGHKSNVQYPWGDSNSHNLVSETSMYTKFHHTGKYQSQARRQSKSLPEQRLSKGGQAWCTLCTHHTGKMGIKIHRLLCTDGVMRYKDEHLKASPERLSTIICTQHNKSLFVFEDENETQIQLTIQICKNSRPVHFQATPFVMFSTV